MFSIAPWYPSSFRCCLMHSTLVEEYSTPVTSNPRCLHIQEKAHTHILFRASFFSSIFLPCMSPFNEQSHKRWFLRQILEERTGIYFKQATSRSLPIGPPAQRNRQSHKATTGATSFKGFQSAFNLTRWVSLPADTYVPLTLMPAPGVPCRWPVPQICAFGPYSHRTVRLIGMDTNCALTHQALWHL